MTGAAKKQLALPLLEQQFTGNENERNFIAAECIVGSAYRREGFPRRLR
jgi:hypothetical protein